MAANVPPGASAPTPPPPTSTTPLTCPKCGSTAAPGSRYRNICGSSLFTQSGS